MRNYRTKVGTESRLDYGLELVEGLKLFAETAPLICRLPLRRPPAPPAPTPPPRSGATAHHTMGSGFWPVEPLPSWPLAFAPQHRNVRSNSPAQA